MTTEPCCGQNPPTCNATDVSRLDSYSRDFVSAVATLASAAKFRGQNGAYLTSCVCHNCAWGQLNFTETSVLTAMTRWYNGTAGRHVTVDPRGKSTSNPPPCACGLHVQAVFDSLLAIAGLNGGGALVGTPSCEDWLLKNTTV